MTQSHRRYRAFISYSRHDEKWARRIHAALEAYRAPRGVSVHVDHRTRRMGRFFRDDDEMPACHSLGASLERALLETDALIVICSPHAARSVWVDTEVRRFRINPNARVFAVIVDGTPNATDQSRECFCPGLRWRVAADGRLTDIPDEPLAPDVRREPLHRVTSRLAAALLGVSFDELWQRETRTYRRRRTLLAGITASFTTFFSLIPQVAHVPPAPMTTAAPVAKAEQVDMLAIARQELADARVVGDVTKMADVLRHALIAARSAPEAARELIIETIAATRIEYRFTGLTDAITHLSITPDGTAAQAVDVTGRVVMLNLTTGHEVNRVNLSGRPLGVSPDGSRIVVESVEGPMLWRTDRWEAVALPVAAGTLTCASFSPTADILATCDHGGTDLWDATTGAAIGEIALEDHPPTQVSFDRQGGRLLLSNGYGAWSFWDAEVGEMTATLHYQGRPLAWKTPGIYSYFATGLAAAPYGAVMTPTGAVPMAGHRAPVTTAKIIGHATDRMHVISADQSGHLIAARIAYPVLHSVFDMKDGESAITALAVTPNMARAISGDEAGTLRVWSLAPFSMAAAAALDTDPVAIACDEAAHHLPLAARRISVDDAKISRALTPLIGKDICTIPLAE